MKIPVDRELPNSLVPTILLEFIIFCIDHCLVRIVDKSLRLHFRSIAQLAKDSKSASTGKKKLLEALSRFKNNMLSRGIDNAGRIELNADGSLKQGVTLNTTGARTLLTPPHKLINSYCELLDGVASTSCTGNMACVIDRQLGLEMNWEGDRVSSSERVIQSWYSRRVV